MRHKYFLRSISGQKSLLTSPKLTFDHKITTKDEQPSPKKIYLKKRYPAKSKTVGYSHFQDLPPSKLIRIGNRFFTEYKESNDPNDGITWTNDPLIRLQRKKRVLFAPSADFDSDEELIKNEKKRMFTDLKQSIQKFVRSSNPLDQI